MPPPAENLDLSDEQRFALMKFRRNVSDCCTEPYHDDYFLLRWLRARRWDPIAAEKMLRASTKWRKEWNIDAIDKWQYPEVFNKYYPSGCCGYDKEGSPVIVVPFAGMDVWGMLHTVTKDDIVKYTIKELEGHLELARQQAKVHGPAASQLVGIIDMSDFNIKQYAWRPAAELVVSTLQMYEANYPEVLKVCFVINVPKVFALAFSVVKNFLHEETIKKLRIFKKEPAKWQAAILNQIPAESVPAVFGGTLTDPDGNPKCTTKVSQGGKVPKSLYSKNQTEKLPDDKDYTLVTVKKGEKLSLDFIAPQEGSFLKWGFYLDDHDIKFGVHCKDIDGKESQVVPLHRVSCNQNEEIGVITCPKPATYTVVFDNSYSYLRSKKLHYTIDIAPPLEASSSIVKREVEE